MVLRRDETASKEFFYERFGPNGQAATRIQERMGLPHMETTFSEVQTVRALYEEADARTIGEEGSRWHVRT